MRKEDKDMRTILFVVLAALLVVVSFTVVRAEEPNYKLMYLESKVQEGVLQAKIYRLTNAVKMRDSAIENFLKQIDSIKTAVPLANLKAYREELAKAEASIKKQEDDAPKD